MSTRQPVCPALVTDGYSDHVHPASHDDLAARGPVGRVLLPGDVLVWVATTREAAEQVFHDARLVKDPIKVTKFGQVIGTRRVPEDMPAVSGRQLMNLDGPDHLRIRRVIGNRLSDMALRVWQPAIDAAVERHMGALAGRASADLLADFATPLVTEVIGTVLGVRPELTSAIMRNGSRLMCTEDPQSPEMIACYQRVVESAVLALEEREASPDGDDLLGAMARARRDGSITRREITSNLIMIMIGADVPVSSFLVHSAAVLQADMPLRRELLDGDTAAVVEQLVESRPPIPFTSMRFAREDMEIAGQHVAAGDAVLVLLTAANRDRSCPVGRKAVAHFSFGAGAHRCPGAPLARRQAVAALPALFRRFPALRLDVPLTGISWNGGIGPRWPDHLPVRLGGEAP